MAELTNTAENSSTQKMERILRGIMRYRNTSREQMVKEFKKVKDNPQVILLSPCRSRHIHRQDISFSCIPVYQLI